MQVSNASAFVSDPKVAVAIGKEISGIAKVPANWTTVQLSLIRRRLLEATERRLQSGTGAIQVSYEILVPTSAASSSAGNVAAFSSLLASAKPAFVPTLFQNAVNSALG